MPFTTRMTTVRLSNNKLWIHSPIAYSKELDNKIKERSEIAGMDILKWTEKIRSVLKCSQEIEWRK